MGCIHSKPAVEDPAGNGSPSSPTPQGTEQGTQAVAASSQVGGEPSTSGEKSSNVVEAGATPTMADFLQNQLDTPGVTGGAGSDGNTLEPAAEQDNTQTTQVPELSGTDRAIARSLGDIGGDALKVLEAAFPAVKTTLKTLAGVLAEVGETLPWVGPAFKLLNTAWKKWRSYEQLQQEMRNSIKDLLHICDTLHVIFQGVKIEGGRIMVQMEQSQEEQQQQQFFWESHFGRLRQAMQEFTGFLSSECSHAFKQALAASDLSAELKRLTSQMDVCLTRDMSALQARQTNLLFKYIVRQGLIPANTPVRLENILSKAGLDQVVGRDEVGSPSCPSRLEGKPRADV
eukprot:scaffold5007_cov203-Prasinococcus_capsulatus_cf.AAC.2